jgi:putative ABC transport system permease protein
MRLSTIFYLYRVRLRARLVQELLAVAGIAVGVALLFASQVANTSLAGSVVHLTNGLVGESRLQLIGRDPNGFDESLLAEVQRLPGVRLAAPVLERGVNVIGESGAESVELIGVGASFVSLNGRLLAHVSATQISNQRGLALPAPVARQIGTGPLKAVLFQVGDRSVNTVAAVILRNSEVGELVDSPVAIAPLGLAQRLVGTPGSINRILVESSPGHELEVRAGLQRIAGNRLDVRPANFEATVFGQAEGPTTQSTELFSAISALVGFLFAFNAMLLTVPQRRKLIGDLRLDGYTPFEIVEVTLFDALMLGLVGSAIGLLLGEQLSHGLLQTNPGYLSFAFPVGTLRIVSWQSIVLAAAGGLFAAIVGVIVPLRHDIFTYSTPSARRSIDSATAQITVALLGGVVCLAITSAILLAGISSVASAVVAFVSLVLALLLILPVAFSAIVGCFDFVQRSLVGVSPTIAAIELQSSSTRARSLAIAATGAIAVFGSVAIEGAQQNLDSGLARVSKEVTRVADLWVSPAGASNTLATTPFKAGAAKLLESLPGVARVKVYRGGFLDIGDRRALVLAPPREASEPLPPNQIVDGELGAATRRLRRSGWATLSSSLASYYHVHIGQKFVLPSPMPTAFRLAATTTNFGWSPGAVIVNAADYARAWASTDPSAYQLTVAPGFSIVTVQQEIRRALGPRAPLVVQTAHEREQVDRSTQRQGLSRLSQIAALVLIAAVLAMAAAMGAMIWQRRPRLAGMKVDGFDQGELWRALLWESGLLLGTGCSIGAVFGLYGQVLLSHALVSVTGFPVVFTMGAPIAIGIFAIVTAVAVAIVALPGYIATQVKPALQD